MLGGCSKLNLDGFLRRGGPDGQVCLRLFQFGRVWDEKFEGVVLLGIVIVVVVVVDVGIGSFFLMDVVQ